MRINKISKLAIIIVTLLILVTLGHLCYSSVTCSKGNIYTGENNKWEVTVVCKDTDIEVSCIPLFKVNDSDNIDIKFMNDSGFISSGTINYTPSKNYFWGKIIRTNDKKLNYNEKIVEIKYDNIISQIILNSK